MGRSDERLWDSCYPPGKIHYELPDMPGARYKEKGRKHRGHIAAYFIIKSAS